LGGGGEFKQRGDGSKKKKALKKKTSRGKKS